MTTTTTTPNICRIDKEQFESHLRKAAAGDSAAQYWTGLCYLYSKGVPKDHEQARHWFHKSSEQGNSKATYRLALCYKQAYGVKKNEEIARNLRLQAIPELHEQAEEGTDTEAMFLYSDSFNTLEQTPENKENRFVWLQKAAAKDHVEAQFYLGKCYQFRQGTEKDAVKAFWWYLKAHENGYDAAQAYLTGIVESELKPLEQTTNDPKILGALVHCYENGIGGIPKNPRRAHVLKRRALAPNQRMSSYRPREMISRLVSGIHPKCTKP